MSRALDDARAAVAVRDRLLARVARKLDESIEAATKSARRIRDPAKARAALGASLDGLALFVRELRIIAEPTRDPPIRRRPFDLVRFVLASIDEHRSHVASAKFEIEVRRRGSVRGRWDRVHLSTVFAEILSNALKYGAGEPIEIRVVARARAVDVITKSRGDAGPIPVIALYGRGKATGQTRGFGIGLWLTRRLAEAHGGSFRIAQRGRVTTAVVSLPCDSASGEATALSITLSPSPIGNA